MYSMLVILKSLSSQIFFLYNILQGDSVLNAITVHSRAERRVSAGIAGKQNAVGGAGVLLLPNLIGAATQLAPGDRYMESL